MSKPVAARGGRRWRCAIYTRKSSEEGLEQAFNSLHAQREACEAYIKSQRHEGWTCLAQAYDDGGLSGATMDRPALQQLLADIQAGRVDVVVCYKVDRLTRSLADFAKIVDGLASEKWRVPMSDEELDDTATTVYEGICGRSGPPSANQRSNAARDRR
jgi:DNA invertase Pin-like site-specific DNA recombinase